MYRTYGSPGLIKFLNPGLKSGATKLAEATPLRDTPKKILDAGGWVECAYWTDKTTVAQYLTKGKMVYAEGSPEADAYTKTDGQVAGTLRMRVQSLQLLGGNTDHNGSNQGNVAHTGSVPAPTMRPQVSVEDDLPF